MGVMTGSRNGHSMGIIGESWEGQGSIIAGSWQGSWKGHGSHSRVMSGSWEYHRLQASSHSLTGEPMEKWKKEKENGCWPCFLNANIQPTAREQTFRKCCILPPACTMPFGWNLLKCVKPCFGPKPMITRAETAQTHGPQNPIYACCWSKLSTGLAGMFVPVYRPVQRYSFSSVC